MELADISMLKEMFPGIENQVVMMIYESCNKRYEETINVLISMQNESSTMQSVSIRIPPVRCWNKCANTIPSDPMQIDDNRMIMFTNKITSFYIYDSIDDKFSKSTQKLKISNEKPHTFTMDTLNSIFYVYTKTGKLLSHNILTKQWKILHGFGANSSHEACSIIIGKNYHIFTVHTHFMWNQEQQKLYQLSGSNTLTNDTLENGITFYLDNEKKCVIVDGNNANIMYSCSIKDYKWKKHQLHLPTYNSFGCILSIDQRYILIFGGKTNNKNKSDAIWIINTNTFSVQKSIAKCPKSGEFFACLMGNEVDLVIDGFIRYCWRSKQFIDRNIRYPSVDVSRIIKAYYGTGSVHLFCRNIGNHWKMRLSDILPINY